MTNRPAGLYTLAAVVALGSALYLAMDFAPLRSQMNQTHTIARVNGTTIPMAEYVRALDTMRAGLARPLTADDRLRALNVLIDEELIVQEALRLNLASDDRLVRKNLVQALINSVILLDAKQDPSEETLRAFFEGQKALFIDPVRVTVQVLRIVEPDNIAAFTQAVLNEVAFLEAGSAAGFEAIHIPAGIPAGKLGELLGGTARDAVLAMQPGDIAGPVVSTGGEIFIWLLRSERTAQDYTQLKERVAAEWQRRQQEQALERYLHRLRKQARITHDADALPSDE